MEGLSDSPRLNRPIVLVVEDEPGDQALIRWQLLEQSDQAFEVHVADSLQAVEQLVAERALEPDVVLLDLNLPDSTGVRTVERCRMMTEAPIVVLTGLDDVAATRLAIESGADDFLSKGGEGESLRRAVRYALLRHVRDSDARVAATVFTHAREGVIITDAQGVVIEVNEMFSRITGYSREEVIGQNPRFLKSGRHEPEFYRSMWQALSVKGHWYGEIWNRRKNGELFAESITISAVRDRRGRIRHFVGLFSDVTEHKEYEQKLTRIAHFDALTSLPNRVLLADRLSQAMVLARRSGEKLALAYIDLDGFKAVNDRFGHDVGDRLLIVLAERMKACLRECDTVARLGGDEFVAVLTSLANDDLAKLIDRLMAAIAAPVELSGNVIQVSGSIGLSFYPQQVDIDPDQLLRQADQAMYQAKLSGKNRFHVFDVDQDTRLRGFHEDIECIRTALARGEFVLYYQPKVNMHTGQVVGVEALIRWLHPERGLLPPSVFLPTIAQHDVEIEMGRWVIDTALSQAERWLQQGLTLPVSVNVAGFHLQQASFMTDLQDLFAAHPAVPRRLLELEVLESSALEDVAHVSGVIEACRGMGVVVALDDFGTGYSSLTYLKRLPADILKIDQSFVRDMLHDPDDLAILEGVLGLARAFRRQVIAEGVETVEHGQLLLQLGCELAQGYGIARPMPPDQIRPWMTQWCNHAAWQAAQPVRSERLPLLYASIDHRAWARSLQAYLLDGSDLLPELESGQCRLGTWLSSRAAKSLLTEAVWRELDESHQRLHQQAGVLVQRGRFGPAGQGHVFTEFERQSERFVTRLMDLSITG